MKQDSLSDRATIGKIRTRNEETDYFNFLLVYGKVPITLPLFLTMRLNAIDQTKL